jgi:crotonobetainyl-CoA:carnitine CoA-transferase CaiB-like acyl-CoA transferase
LCAVVLGAPEAATDARFATNVARVRNRAETDALVAAQFCKFDERALVDRLSRADIAFASVNDMEALSKHPSLRRITVATPSGPISYPAPAPIFTGVSRTYGSAPALGEPSNPEPIT